MAPYRRSNVCGLEKSTRTAEEEEKPLLPAMTHHTFDKRHTSSSQPSELFTRTRWHKEGTGHPHSRGTLCLNCFKIRRKQTSQLSSEGHIITSFSFCNTRRAQNPNQPRLHSTSCNSWHNRSRAMWTEGHFPRPSRANQSRHMPSLCRLRCWAQTEPAH